MFRYIKVKKIKSTHGQAIMEFTFSMILVLLLFWGILQIFRWTGRDLAERRIAHDQLLVTGFTESWTNVADGNLKQLDTFFYFPIAMNAVWKGTGMGF